MADNPFDQTNYGLREKPVSGDWNQLESQIYMTIREMHRYQHDARTDFTTPSAHSVSGFHGAGFWVVPSSPAAMSVVVSAGLGFLYAPTDIPTNLGATDLESVDDLSPYKPLLVQSPLTFNVPAAPASPNSRIDIIEVRNPRRLENAITRRQLDPNTLSYDDHVFFKTLAYQIDNNRMGVVNDPASSTAELSYKVGTAANPGLVPATSPGYLKIAEILVPNGISTITGTQLVDRRPLLFSRGGCTVHASFRWQFVTGFPASIITPIKGVLPPSVQVGLRQNTNVRGDGILAIVGGEIASAVLTPSVYYPTAAASLGSGWGFPAVFADVSGTNGTPITVDSAAQAVLASLTPAINVGIGQKAVLVQIRSRFQLDAVSKDPSASLTPLEDFVLNVAAGLSW